MCATDSPIIPLRSTHHFGNRSATSRALRLWRGGPCFATTFDLETPVVSCPQHTGTPPPELSPFDRSTCFAAYDPVGPVATGAEKPVARRGYSHHRPLLLTGEPAVGKHERYYLRHSRCSRAHMRQLGRSRWPTGLCRCLHSGCTDGTGPRPSIEP
jgi:hypothetical protein